MKPKLPQPAPVERRYIAAADLCKACGLTVYRLDTELRPDDWASPRDFTYRRTGELMLEASSLARLADTIEARGFAEVANRVRDYAANLPAPIDQDNRLVPVQRELEAPDIEELNHRFAGARAHASDRESSRFWWED